MLGYFKAPRKAKIKGAGLFFSATIQGARGFGFRCYRCKAEVHSWLIVFLDSLLSQRMTEWGHTRTFVNLAHSPSSPSLKSGGPFLAECISGFPAFAENDGDGNAASGLKDIHQLTSKDLF